MDTPSRREILTAGSVAILPTAGCLWRGSDSTREGTPQQSPASTATRNRESSPAVSETPTETVTATQTQVEPPAEITTSWPYPNYSQGRTGVTPETPGPLGEVSKLWEHHTDDVLSPPVIVDETLYVIGQSGRIRALEAATGTELWTESVSPVGRSVAILDNRLWVRTGETVLSFDRDGNRLWQLTSHDYRRGEIASHGVYYLERRYGTTFAVGADHSGERRWRRDLVSQEREEIVAGPAHVYAVSGPEYELYKLAAESGDRETISVPGGSPKGLTVGGGELFYADRTGNLYAPNWWLDLAGFGVSSPRVGPGTVFVFVSDGENSGLNAFDRETGRHRWRTAGIDVRDFVATTETVIACTPTRLIAFDTSDGTMLWETEFSKRNQQTLAVVDDIVYVSHASGIVGYRGP